MRKKTGVVLILVVMLIFIQPLKSKAEEMELYAQSAVLMDGDTGRILFGKKEKEVRAMASTTKIMTCILILENMDLTECAEVSKTAAAQPKVHLGVQEGEHYYVKDLLYSLMLESHNDAAVVLAEKEAGSVAAFAKKMNEKAKELGCYDTHFVTPNGLDATDEGGEHRTTAADLAKILSYCITASPQKERFLEITRTPFYEFTDVSGKRHFACSNHNAFLGMMDGAVTGKTGFTGKAGYCYVGAVKSEGRTFVAALLGCGWPNNKGYKWADMKKLMNYAKEHFFRKEISFQIKTPEILVTKGVPKSGSLKDPCRIQTEVAEDEKMKISLLVSEKDEIKMNCSMKQKTDAPVGQNEVVGHITLLLNGEEILCKNVITSQKAERITMPWCANRVWSCFLMS